MKNTLLAVSILPMVLLTACAKPVTGNTRQPSPVSVADDASGAQRIKGVVKQNGVLSLICDDNSLAALRKDLHLPNRGSILTNGTINTWRAPVTIQEGQAISMEGVVFDASQLNLGSSVGRDCSSRPLPSDPIVDAKHLTLKNLLKAYPSLQGAPLETLKDIDKRHAVPNDEYPTLTIVTDAESGSVFYVADEEKSETSPHPSLDHKGTTWNAVYRIDPAANTIRLLTRLTLQNRSMSLYGRDGDRLIFEVADLMNSPGPCYSPWIRISLFQKSELIQSLSISKPSGLESYIIPPKRFDTEMEKQWNCEIGMDR